MPDSQITGAGPRDRSLYDAFISYSHAKDKPVAAALQSVIQRLGKPWYQRRMLRIFRDDTSLAATPELWPTLEKTLHQSRYIIILASPQFARSKWCGMEVAHWLRHKSLDTLLIALTEGDLLWDEAASDFVFDETTPLPALLKGHFRSEPKWIDLRPWRDAPDAGDPKFIDAAADLAAAVHGVPKEDLLSQEVRQQKRALRLAWSAAASLAADAAALASGDGIDGSGAGHDLLQPAAPAGGGGDQLPVGLGAGRPAVVGVLGHDDLAPPPGWGLVPGNRDLGAAFGALVIVGMIHAIL